MKKLIPLIGAAAVLAAAAFLLVNRPGGSPGGKSSGGRVLDGFRPELVTGIFIEGPEGSVRLKDAGGNWAVAERSDYPADAAKIRSMILEAWNMKAVQQIRLGDGSQARLQLVAPGGNPPAAVAETATRLQFLGANGTVLAEVLLGLPRVSDPMDGLPGRPIGRYVMLPGSGTADLVSETFKMVSPAPAPWLDKSFIRIENPTRIERTGAEGWAVKRENDGWVPEAPPKGTFQPGLISSAVAMWSSPAFDDLGIPADVPAPESGQDEVVITAGDGTIYKIQRGTAQGTRTPVRLSITEPGKTEKSETGDGQPPAASGNNTASSGIGEQPGNKRFDGRVYLLPTTTVDALFIKKSDLFVVPPESDSGAEKPPGSPAG